MKILVIEDTQKHVEAAREQLKGHELTVVTTIKEAVLLFNEGEAKFDAILTDLYLPAPDEAFDGWAFYPGLDRKNDDWATDVYRKGTPLPAGLIFAIAARMQGVMVGILTDTCHHLDQVVALLDLIAPPMWYSRRREVQKVVFCPDGRKYIKDGQKCWDMFLRSLQAWEQGLVWCEED